VLHSLPFDMLRTSDSMVRYFFMEVVFAQQGEKTTSKG
jgi:hypothetical protein